MFSSPGGPNKVYNYISIYPVVYFFSFLCCILYSRMYNLLAYLFSYFLCAILYMTLLIKVIDPRSTL